MEFSLYSNENGINNTSLGHSLWINQAVTTQLLTKHDVQYGTNNTAFGNAFAQ
jgi:hypothetical protein